MSDVELPEPDRIEGALHPRETPELFGQGRAEADFLTAFNTGRLHHGWMLTGPRGVGKATLAWRIARFLLATPLVDKNDMFGAPPPPETLDISPDHPVAHRVLALSEPGLFLLRRGPTDKGDKLAAEIRVNEVRKLGHFFSLSAADGGRRVVIVDSADELNIQAANAILKMLEEPPANTTILLISHQPARLLPTIRSRCRVLRLGPLSPDDMTIALAQADAHVDPADAPALTELSQGSVGEALRLINLGGLQLYSDILAVLGSLPNFDRARMLSLSDSCAGKGKEARLDLLLTLVDQLTARLARTGVTGHPPLHEAAPQEAGILARLSPDPHTGRHWATLAGQASDRARHARAVNVDPAALVTDLFLQLKI
ncbi:DNA polymerase III subunit delta' [uncultured Pelagimonas sp.]|uniref:DNA polymerase III subunit delta' n=1 Tax=uncultured Pelagimonas sp. TaxID=1618102 RepID=UPI00260676AA|nr:DNA polymerase III subunit delta' [uncultured Pelagimonas sp.]